MPTTEEAVEFPPSAGQFAVPLVVGMVLATGLVYLGLRWAADPMTVAELRACAYTAALGVVGALILPHSGGAQLTPEYLVALSAFGQRERHIRWADVSAIDVHRMAGVSRVSVSLVTGKRLILASGPETIPASAALRGLRWLPLRTGHRVASGPSPKSSTDIPHPRNSMSVAPDTLHPTMRNTRRRSTVPAGRRRARSATL
ncbi:hypothetical protein [Streptomyces sp. NPDC002133]|uniref:hypothetical protein n=1 Tax=Streptomyces sp. NPDC002133 TaxID=3154409 RepID=UPI0033314F45